MVHVGLHVLNETVKMAKMPSRLGGAANGFVRRRATNNPHLYPRIACNAFLEYISIALPPSKVAAITSKHVKSDVWLHRTYSAP